LTTNGIGVHTIDLFVLYAADSDDSTVKTMPYVANAWGIQAMAIRASTSVGKVSANDRGPIVRIPSALATVSQQTWPVGPVDLTTSTINDAPVDPFAIR
jgi:hypothetical protein